MLQIFIFIVLILSAVIHEISHGFVANILGDSTARYAGRLSLNPLKHLDPFGSVILPLMLFLFGSPFIFGAAKPVPINPYNLRNQKRDLVLVGLAGPASNFLIAGIFAVILALLPLGGADSLTAMGLFISAVVAVNLILGIFNLIPVPPLDGSRLIAPILPRSVKRYFEIVERQSFLGIFIALIVAYYIVFPFVIGAVIKLFLGKWAIFF